MKKQMSDSLTLAVFLTLAGGFQDAYSYNCRGQVFANAQTGNIVLLGQNLATGHPGRALHYLFPLLAFMLGVYLAELVCRRYANAQTGNIVLLGQNLATGHPGRALHYLFPLLAFMLGVYLAELVCRRYQNSTRIHWRQLGQNLATGHPGRALHYLFPLLAFMLGVYLAELVCRRYQNSTRIHWRQTILLAEILLLVIAGLLPQSLNAFMLGVYLAELVCRRYQNSTRIHWRQTILLAEILLLVIAGLLPQSLNIAANVLLSFACAMQVNAFRKFRGLPCATTMCIGNMRSAASLLCGYHTTGDPELKRKSMHYYFVIAVFAVGAAIGAVLTQRIGERAIWIAAGLQLIGFLLMFAHEPDPVHID